MTPMARWVVGASDFSSGLALGGFCATTPLGED
jgi:hypothetical protein